LTLSKKHPAIIPIKSSCNNNSQNNFSIFGKNIKSVNITIIEDDSWYANFLRHQISLNEDHNVQHFEDGTTALKTLKQAPDVITVDYSLPDIDGKELVSKLKQRFPETEIIMISGQNEVALALDVLRLGIHDYIIKDDNTKDRLWHALLQIGEKRKLTQEVVRLTEEVRTKYSFSKLIKGDQKHLLPLFKLMQKACETSINVSITGETGTGKELVAKAIHYNSKQANGPFVAVNLSAIPSELIESELFGHEKGAFTGAQQRRIGKFEEAQGGTLFLDEIGEVDLNTQVKLLRVLQEFEIQRVGDNKTIKISCRIITATHRNLGELVKEGKFRQDFYFRILGLPIELTPLRQRKTDILLLANYFLEEFSKANKLPRMNFSEAARHKLLNYHFPGNIRELRSIVDLACILADEGTIDAQHLQFQSSVNGIDLMDKELTLDEVTEILILKHYKKYKSLPKIAQLLGVGKSTIYRFIQSRNMNLND
jgi:two-component system response regulator AtoC